MSAVSESSMIMYCVKDGPLGPAKKRAAYVCTVSIGKSH